MTISENVIHSLLYPNLEALGDGRIGSGAKVGEYPLLRYEAKSAVRELAKYAALVERCRNDKTHGCWCGVHIAPVAAVPSPSPDLPSPEPPQPNDLCKCGHTRREHTSAWHGPRVCPCGGFVVDLWTEEEIAELQRKAAEDARILGWK